MDVGVFTRLQVTGRYVRLTRRLTVYLVIDSPSRRSTNLKAVPSTESLARRSMRLKTIPSIGLLGRRSTRLKTVSSTGPPALRMTKLIFAGSECYPTQADLSLGASGRTSTSCASRGLMVGII